MSKFSDIIKKKYKTSFFRFLVVGGCSTLIDFIVYMFLSQQISLNISKITSMIVASLFSYLANKLFTFKNYERTYWLYLIKFYIVFILNLATNVFVNYVFFHLTGCKVFAFILATIAGMMVNYIGQKYYVFSSKQYNVLKGNNQL